ncbi:hypothetical protein KUL156_59160 [Alteromonas sp. KUL156]|uniref:hypothetical protein n=1 Tax=Alteromonas sp. KUL106 TaxID=2480799 RepID=UPI0012E4E2CC|nr:hypothetical protein [Alteromonas sp. KUL106]GFD69360.1 hypothetical protein KUL106_26230 [Alteromonas sp. KUL106]GFD94618.1 hypothetical protein KUL154_33510 [Alteromonas sp. KUL154]GFE03324.1 hypothetical protein KUL156_59160 [Alteromonas sp. KUL156]
MNNLFRVVILSLAITLSSACAINYPTPSASLKINSIVTLPEELAETSGLFCEEEGMYSLNDSGNAPVIFHVNYQGEITEQTRLALTNKDWEAITADSAFFYIADVGNNKGKREQVEIHKVNRSNVNDIETITLKYAGNNANNNIPYAHDFDSEAMVMFDNKLLLFSKSWRTGITHIYHVNDTKSVQTLSPFASIEGLPGVVTGVDFDRVRNRFVITGYKSDPFGNFATFLAQVSKEFTLLDIWPLDEYKQVEGVCVDTEGRYWFSEEATEGREASLSSAYIEAK